MCYPHIVNFLGGRASAMFSGYRPLLPIHHHGVGGGGEVVDADTSSFLGRLWAGVREGLGYGFRRRKVGDSARGVASIEVEGAASLRVRWPRIRCTSPASQSVSTDSFYDYYTQLEHCSEPPAPQLEHRGATFTLRARLGEGALSRVVLAGAHFPGLCGTQDVAVEVISKARAVARRRRTTSWADMVLTARGIASEIAILRAVRSPFLTPLLAAFQDGENVYLVMTLARRMQRVAATGTRLGVEEIRLYAAEIFCSPRALHEEHRAVHRDLKFQNILISPAGHLALADFGLAMRQTRVAAAAAESLKVGEVGTLPYLAPEVFKPGHTVFFGAALDIWAFGVLLLEMFEATGQPHFSGDRDCELTLFRMCIVNRNRKERLTLAEIGRHPFFSTFDWDRVERRQYARFVGSLNYVPTQPESYRSDPMPLKCSDASVAFLSTCWSPTQSSGDVDLDLEMSADVTVGSMFGELEVDYICPPRDCFDPLH
ncbi:kinase-like domain-containing protein [Mycena rosella]|uniref:Kinase-like domain-containing protein n=1 Tax=Mycena rosella TaxID=1033263 RepID=A0AAD7GLR6_MYCRO|nr:kinase-like domain-containing protein [Mycena rosella]